MTALPTRADEAWRYTPAPVLAGLAAQPDAAQVAVAAGAQQALYRSLTDEGIATLSVTLAPGARLEAFFLLAGAGYRRLDLNVTLAEGAHFEMGCVAVACEGESAEVVTRIRHAAPGATSNQLVRAVAAGNGVVNVLGRIDVAEDAQQTDAALGIKGLLQGARATINAKPELEIFADDVKCAHGCAIGQLDEAALFYAQQRGLPLPAAQALLVQAFAAEAFREAGDDAAREALETQAATAIRGAL